MAEALVEVADPLATVLRPGAGQAAEEVRAALARSLAPAAGRHSPPPWLRPEQRLPFARVLAALERHGAALLADPVGSGKTFVALAVISLLGARQAAVIVPAALAAQWRERSAALGLSVAPHSHELLGRGRLPPGEPTLVVIDESHRFRHPEIRRYRVLARWLVGRRVLLLSATPVVTRLTDLAHQLLLGLPDDALAPRGVPSLRAALAGRAAPPALGDVVLSRPAAGAGPARRPVRAEAAPSEQEQELLAGLAALRLSRVPAIAALVRSTLLRALGSSPAALAGALRRYRALLQQARDAAQAGHGVSRSAIRRFAGPGLGQLVLWDLLPPAEPGDLALDDLPAVTPLLRAAGAAAPSRLTPLRAALADGRPTLLFTAQRETLEWLRGALHDLSPAWLTGSAAGRGHLRVPRATVLGWFAPGASAPAAGRLPSLLLATDVAAEGLDLQRAARVVHFDLPWTCVRLDQREGRALRLGNAAAAVELVRFAPWPALESALGVERALRRTGLLAAAAGVDGPGRWLYRWRVELADAAGPGPAEAGSAVVRGHEAGWLVGLALDQLMPGGGLRRSAAELIWLGDDGRVGLEPQEVSARLAAVSPAPEARPADSDDLLCRLLPLVRERLAAATRTSWLARAAPPEHRRLVRRLREQARGAARRRDWAATALADEALAWLAGGVTAGEAIRLAELAEAADPLAAPAWRPLLARPRVPVVLAPRLTGVLRVTTFPPCQRSAPCCSTSTEPSSIPSS